MNRNFIFLSLIAIALAGCAGSRNQVETVQDAAMRNGGDLPESGVYNNEQNENLAITVKTLQSEIFEQNQKIFELQKEVQAEKLKNQTLVHEQEVLQAKAGIKVRRDAASIKGWKPNGDPIIEHKSIEEQ